MAEAVTWPLHEASGVRVDRLAHHEHLVTVAVLRQCANVHLQEAERLEREWAAQMFAHGRCGAEWGPLGSCMREPGHDGPHSLDREVGPGAVVWNNAAQDET